jgi:hypothetical protein
MMNKNTPWKFVVTHLLYFSHKENIRKAESDLESLVCCFSLSISYSLYIHNTSSENEKSDVSTKHELSSRHVSLLQLLFPFTLTQTENLFYTPVYLLLGFSKKAPKFSGKVWGDKMCSQYWHCSEKEASFSGTCYLYVKKVRCQYESRLLCLAFFSSIFFNNVYIFPCKKRFWLNFL